MSAKVTIKDVAKEADCSASLVSLYLRTPRTTRVAEDTKKRIDRAVEKLNYQRNMLASILKSGSSNVIGVLADAQANPPIFRLIACLEQEADKRNMRLQLGLFHDNPDNLLEACSILKQYGAAGIICLCHDYPEFNSVLDRQLDMFPELVFYDGPPRDGHACVMPDREYAVQLAFNTLRQKGRSRIALCVPGKCPDWYSVLCKVQAFRQLASDDAMICHLPHDLPLRKAVQEVLLPFMQTRKPDALICSKTTYALCASDVLRHAGFRIPGDVALVGFDNDPACEEQIPSVSSLAPDQKLIAQKLFDLVLAKDNEPRMIRIKPELILRESC